MINNRDYAKKTKRIEYSSQHQISIDSFQLSEIELLIRNLKHVFKDIKEWEKIKKNRVFSEGIFLNECDVKFQKLEEESSGNKQRV